MRKQLNNSQLTHDQFDSVRTKTAYYQSTEESNVVDTRL